MAFEDGLYTAFGVSAAPRACGPSLDVCSGAAVWPGKVTGCSQSRPGSP